MPDSAMNSLCEGVGRKIASCRPSSGISLYKDYLSCLRPSIELLSDWYRRQQSLALRNQVMAPSLQESKQKHVDDSMLRSHLQTFVCALICPEQQDLSTPQYSPPTPRAPSPYIWSSYPPPSPASS